MADPYDRERESEGLGVRSEIAPDFLPPEKPENVNDPKESSASPKSAEAKGPKDYDNPNSATQKEMDALDEGNQDPKGGFFSDESVGGKMRGKKGILANLSNKAKGRIAASLVGVAVAGTAAGFIMPSTLEMFQLVHYSETLKSIIKPHEAQRSTRYSRIYKNLRPGDRAARSRLSWWQNMKHPSLIKNLERQGIKITTNNRGQVRFIDLDIQKFPDWQGKSRTQVVDAMGKEFGVKPGQISGDVTPNSTLRISDVENMPFRNQDALLSTSVKQLGKGRRGSFVALRQLRRAFNVPSAFHPFKRAEVRVETKVNNLVERALARKKPLQDKVNGARKSMGEFVNNNRAPLRGAGAALMVAGIACMIGDFESGISEANFKTFVEPGVQAGADAMAMGDQVSTPTHISDDVTSESIDSENANFYSASGYSVFDSDSIRQLSGMPPTAKPPASDKKATEEYNAYQSGKTQFVAGFSYDNGFRSAVQFMKSIPGYDAICSPTGRAVDLLAGTALTVLVSFPSGGAGGVGLSLLKGVVFAGVISQGMSLATDYMTTDLPEIAIHQGLMGGDFDAYGVQALSNSVAATSGGSVVSASAQAEIMKQVALDDKASLANKTVAARLFDAKNPKSFTSKLAVSVNPKPFANISKATSSFTDIIGSVASLPAKLLSTKVFAEEPRISFNGVPLIASQPQVMNITDPFANAEAAASILDSSSGQGYIDKAKKCYGNEIKKVTVDGQSLWDAVSVGFVNPASSDYPTDCGNMSDPNWVVITGFIQSTHDMDEIGCMDINDEESCERLGYGGGTSDGAGGSTPGTPASNDFGDLYQDSTSIACDPRTKPAGTAEVSGNKPGGGGAATLKINICEIPDIPQPGMDGGAKVNSRVSKAFADLADIAKSKGVKLSATSSFRTRAKQQELYDRLGSPMATKPGLSNHEMGYAIDFAVDGGKKSQSSGCGSGRAIASSEMWKFLDGNAHQLGINQLDYESWHWDVLPGDMRCKETYKGG